MKKVFTLCCFILFALVVIASWNYAGPRDGRIPPVLNATNYTLGWYARNANAIAVMDVIGVADTHPDSVFGCITGRVVNAVYGCTNGQEFVLLKVDTNPFEMYEDELIWNFEYYPTNNSRIVCAFIMQYPLRNLPLWKPITWKKPPIPEIIMSPTNSFWLTGHARGWWYDGYQDNLPLMHLTNLLYSAQTERNWTNYYHKVRDALPTPASPRVWQDSFYDIDELLMRATQAQFDYMMNDPLFPPECVEMMQFNQTRFNRIPEDEPDGFRYFNIEVEEEEEED